MSNLDMIFNGIKWSRKFTHQCPTSNIVKVWSEDEFKDAERYFKKHTEETKKVCRIVYLSEFSAGQQLIVVEEAWSSL